MRNLSLPVCFSLAAVLACLCARTKDTFAWAKPQQQQQQRHVQQNGRSQESSSKPAASFPLFPSRPVDDYAIVRRLGTGKFSDVFEAVEPTSAGENVVVLKCLKPVSERKVQREIQILHHVRHLPNLVRLLAIVVPPTKSGGKNRNFDNNMMMPTLVLEHAGRGQNAQWLCHSSLYSGSRKHVTAAASSNSSTAAQKSPQQPPTSAEQQQFLTDYEIRYYTCHLLVALDALHSHGIMHRDVKPRNILIHRCSHPRGRQEAGAHPTEQQLSHQPPLTLIDLGLADMYSPGQAYNVKVASRHYKSPELLLLQLLDFDSNSSDKKNKTNSYIHYYDGRCVDMWAVGCILAGLLFRREPFFRGRDNPNQLEHICSFLGRQDLRTYLTRLSFLQQEQRRQNGGGEGVKVLSPAVLVDDGEALLDQLSFLFQHRPVVEHRQSLLSIWNQLQQKQKQQHPPNGGSSNPPPLPSLDGMDLIDRLLVYDPAKRLTAPQALQHSFFDSVRERVYKETNVD